MFGRFAARGIALLLMVLPLVGGVSGTAFAQYQVQINVGVTDVDFAQAAVPEPFGLDVLPVTSGELLNKWSSVIADIRAESETLARCRDDAELCPPAAQKFLAVITDGRAHEGRARFGIVNRAINLAIKPTSDLVQWGVIDRWSAPLATLTTGRGDCEDYAIAKYVALKEAGVAEDDLRLVIVRDLVLGQDHAVVAARLEGKWMMLDNRRFLLLVDNEMPRVLPLFELGRAGVKQFTPALVAEAHKPTAPGAIGF